MAETKNPFLCVGGVPHTEWADDVGIGRDQEGYLVTGPDERRQMAGELATGPCAILRGDEHPRHTRSGRRKARIGKAMRFGGGRGGHGGDIRAPVLG